MARDASRRLAPPGAGWVVAATFLLTTAAAGPVRAAGGRLEYAIKATFLYKLAAFVEWPGSAFDNPASPITICVVGTNPFGRQLEQATAGQRIGGRPFQIRYSGTVERNTNCHVAYLADADPASASRALQAVRGKPVLTVTDASFQDSSRGVVHFVLRNERVRFEINSDAAVRNGVTLSSKLTSLAVSDKARPYSR